MANPIFAKDGVPSVTLGQAPDWPSVTPVKPRQRIGRSDGGYFKVVTLSRPDQEFHLVFSDLPSSDHDALVTFLQDPRVNYAAHPFLYTDHEGRQQQVRFLDGELPAPEVAPGVHDVRLTLVLDRGPLN